MKFQRIDALSGEAAAWFTGVTDLVFAQGPQGLRLYAGGRAGSGGPLGGGLASLTLSGKLSVADRQTPPAGAVAGIAPDVTLVEARDGPVALLTGAAGRGLWALSAGADGQLRGAGAGWSIEDPARIAFTATLDTPQGALLFGAGMAGAAPLVWRIGAQGATPVSTPAIPALPKSGLAPVAIADMAAHDGPQGPLMIAALRGETALLSWRPDAQGRPREVGRLDPEDGLWISEPGAVATLTLGGRGYAVVAGQGGGTLSVARIGNTGALTLVDHLIDDRHSRFGGAHLLATAELDGAAYVLAGGTDQGLSLLRMLPGGRLVHLMAVEDAAGLNLTGLTAMAMTARVGALEIVTASGRETGLVWQRITPGAGAEQEGTKGGDRLSGGAGADLIRGHGGDDSLFGGAGRDILCDGAGRDQLRGGAGGDLFVMAADGEPDTILDFDMADDRLDLSGWRFLRSAAQLALSITAEGAEIRFGDELLRLVPAGGGGFTLEDLARLPLAPLGRLLPEWTEPLAALETGLTLNGTPGADTLSGSGGDDLIRGWGAQDRLQGGDGDDSLLGGEGSDRIAGGPGDDAINGGIGWDEIAGGGGADAIAAMDGYDTVHGGAGDDHVTGNNGFDTLFGEAGDDTLSGGMSPDSIDGGAGHDLLSGDAGTDRIAGGRGDDTISGNAGADHLSGGAGDDLIRGGINHDRLEGGAGHDSLRGEAGADRLQGGAGDDLLHGGGGADVFVFAASGGGRDRIADFTPGQDMILLDPALLDRPGDARAAVTRHGSLRDGEALLDFGDQLIEIPGLARLGQLVAGIEFM